MIIQIRIVNNTSVEYIQLQNLKLSIKAVDGKGIESYKESKRNIIIPAKSVKNLTVTIRKRKKLIYDAQKFQSMEHCFIINDKGMNR